jgi:hypothetical protein
MLIGLTWAVWPIPAATQTSSPQIIQVPDQGRAHVVPGQPHPPYNSNPPTSGWHYTATAQAGFYDRVLPDELIVHNLEHGEVWITYRDNKDADVVASLAALAQEFPDGLIITHRPRNDSRIAVAAWTWLIKLDRYDKGPIVSFYRRFVNIGSEPWD